MLEYDRIDTSESIDINGPYICNDCYDMSLKAISMKTLTAINYNGNDYRVNFAFISKKDAFNLIKNAVIIYKKRNIINVVDTKMLCV